MRGFAKQLKLILPTVAAVVINLLPLSGINTSFAAQSDGPLTCPVSGRPPINSGYGNRGGSFHAGIDLGVSSGTTLYASVSGNASPKTDSGGYGYYVDITSDDGSILVRYGHMQGNGRASGHVSAGSVIGLSDTSGDATGPHLHWEIHVPASGGSVNPTNYWNNCSQPGGGGGNPTPPPGGGGGGGGSYNEQGNPYGCSGYPHPTLRKGSSGACVQHLQWFLKNRYCYSLSGSNGGVDGSFGGSTLNAVVDFQKKHIGPNQGDGAVGPNTWNHLHNDGACSAGGTTPQPQPQPQPTPQPSGGLTSIYACSHPTLSQGASGDCVRHLQDHLNHYGSGLTIDGSFGPLTKAAVQKFQFNYHVPNSGCGSSYNSCDGIVGPATWSKLHSG